MPGRCEEPLSLTRKRSFVRNSSPCAHLLVKLTEIELSQSWSLHIFFDRKSVPVAPEEERLLDRVVLADEPAAQQHVLHQAGHVVLALALLQWRSELADNLEGGRAKGEGSKAGSKSLGAAAYIGLRKVERNLQKLKRKIFEYALQKKLRANHFRRLSIAKRPKH